MCLVYTDSSASRSCIGSLSLAGCFSTEQLLELFADLVGIDLRSGSCSPLIAQVANGK